MRYKQAGCQRHLRIFEDRSEYHADNRHTEMFHEGTVSQEATRRNQKVRDGFKGGFFEDLISSLLEGKISVDTDKISEPASESVNALVDSLTSQVGRALIGLSVMQLCIKSVCPDQNIRLHKGSFNRASFSWVEGISMRTLDKKYVTPILRKYNLLRLNADGFMMTRSLAENYPYTFLYKARLRGAREQWLILVEELEKGGTSPIETLKYLLSRLINAASIFDEAADELLKSVDEIIGQYANRSSVASLLKQHLDDSDYAARLLEIGMHSLMQAAVETGAFEGMEVKPLSQMRSANKKHGNIGDIELLDEYDQIIEAWDAKYGKAYLREEIEEATEKLRHHAYVKLIGFVTNAEIERSIEISKRIEDIEQLYSVNFEVITYDDWVDRIYGISLSSGTASEEKLSQKWLVTYCEYLCQRRRANAPIDEPCFDWVLSLSKIL